ncbi:WhiB family transcriptional regulator [Actinomadura rupiterrae]|uniref:WhiB family transcriptional regulator n=1 Tax=Actinomadura rupiterrae TaxID=559627 RepID=UPI0020A40649|nr:WhiB family transcriptional regulator [Actinomadura rupiterrae]MCP2343379.1 WhiB family redox-sensing transcriptional regulator [Actinomadura rupiterrae]
MTVRPSLLRSVDLLDALAENAACRWDPELHTGPDVFTPESVAERQARMDVAREVCERCPVWAECLDYALRVRPSHGMWAGLSVRELNELRRNARQMPSPVPADLPAAA